MDMVSTWLKSASLAPHTERAYRVEVDRFMVYLDRRNLALAELGSRQLERFWAQLRRGRLHNVATLPSHGSLQQSRRILCAFLRWCAAAQLTPPDILTELRRSSVRETEAHGRPVRATPSAVPVANLLRIADLDGAAAALSFWAGASPQELGALRTDAFDWAQSQVTIARRSAETSVVLPESLSASLRVLARGKHTYFFGHDAPASAASIAYRISKWGKRQGSATASARALRARFLEMAKLAGWTPDEIRGQMRRRKLALDAPQPPPLKRVVKIERVAGAASHRE